MGGGDMLGLLWGYFYHLNYKTTYLCSSSRRPWANPCGYASSSIVVLLEGLCPLVSALILMTDLQLDANKSSAYMMM